MTRDGYPTRKELKYIRDFDILKEDPLILMKYIKERWCWHDFFTIRKKSPRLFKDRKVWGIKMITGGWSGNEDLIRALKGNKFFFLLYHKRWEAGGLWYFEIPIS